MLADSRVATYLRTEHAVGAPSNRWRRISRHFWAILTRCHFVATKRLLRALRFTQETASYAAQGKRGSPHIDPIQTSTSPDDCGPKSCQQATREMISLAPRAMCFDGRRRGLLGHQRQSKDPWM